MSDGAGAWILIAGGVGIGLLALRQRPGPPSPPPNGAGPCGVPIPPPSPRQYTFGGRSCATAGVDGWILQLIASGKITVAEACALVLPPLSGNLSAWLATLQRPLGANDLQALAFRCAVAPPCTRTPFPGPVPIPDGALVTYEGSGPRVWVIEGRRRRQVLTSRAFSACGYRLSDVRFWRRDWVIPTAGYSGMPPGCPVTGPPDCPPVRRPPPTPVL